MKRSLPVIFLLVCFWGIASYGLNFGIQWDEGRAKFDAIRDTLNSGLFLQGANLDEYGGNYNHGGVNYLLTWFALTPEILKYLTAGPRTREELSRVILPILY